MYEFIYNTIDAWLPLSILYFLCINYKTLILTLISYWPQNQCSNEVPVYKN